MNKFIIEIPNEKAKTYKLITFIILVLNFFVFGFVFVHLPEHTSTRAAVAGLVVNAVPAIYYLLNKRHIKSPLLELSFFISAMLWLFWGNYVAAILMVVFSLLGFFASKKPAISFSAEGIDYPSFPAKHYSWADVEQVILKDDILTIDLKSNKLMQFNLDKAVSANINTTEFNDQTSYWLKTSTRQS